MYRIIWKSNNLNSALTLAESVNDFQLEENITKSRKTVYALMGAGSHGYNGLHPKVSLKLWHTYVLTRLVYGLEVFKCSKSDFEKQELFQRNNLRRFQFLPEGTPNYITLLLVNANTVQSVVERKVLVLFNNLIHLDRSKEREIILR